MVSKGRFVHFPDDDSTTFCMVCGCRHYITEYLDTCSEECFIKAYQMEDLKNYKTPVTVPIDKKIIDELNLVEGNLFQIADEETGSSASDHLDIRKHGRDMWIKGAKYVIGFMKQFNKKNNNNLKQQPMIKVYIASPYTLGDVAVNVKLQLDVADELMNLGFAPFVPLYSHFQHMVHPRPYTDWVKIDLEWVTVCDCVLRLGGESKGADGEVDFARERNMLVFWSVEELSKHYNN